VESDRATFGLVPVENSIEGMVSHTLDLLMEFDLKICGEVFLKITHYLVSIANTLGYVKRIYSHSQALAQCRQWIEHNLPRAELVELTSTARAAERAREEEGAAAVASLLAAELYGLSVLARGIEDNPHNYTRFLVIGKKPPAPSGNDKTSILFSVKDAPGALFKALSPFAEQKVNLTKIESRPSKKKPWEYVFFVDMAGHLEEEAVRKALEELWADAVDLRVLGRYDWRLSERNVWKVERVLIGMPHRPLRTSDTEYAWWHRRFVHYKAHFPDRRPAYFPNRDEWL